MEEAGKEESLKKENRRKYCNAERIRRKLKIYTNLR
jgi:hypothetical protein